MKTVTKKRSRSFKAKTPEEFDRRYADICDELAEYDFDKPEKDGDMYHVYYTYTERIAESADAAVKGARRECRTQWTTPVRVRCSTRCLRTARSSRERSSYGDYEVWSDTARPYGSRMDDMRGRAWCNGGAVNVDKTQAPESGRP